MLGLTKLAASFDARRAKQYWQMLTKLHGGNDEAIAAIKQTGDHGIYHGTNPSNVQNVLQNGLQANAEKVNGQQLGRGVYLGNREKAMQYTKENTLFSKEHRSEGMLQIKPPSELRGTKQLYPQAQNVMKADITDPEVYNHVKQTAIRKSQQQFNHHPDEVWEQPGNNFGDVIDRERTHIKTTFNAPPIGNIHDSVPNSKLKTFGQLGGGMKPIYNNQMISQQHIPPELIRQAAQIVLGIEKQAHLNDDIKLYPHQQHFVNKPGNAVIAAHPVGSGKTLSGIARFEHLRDTGAAHRALVVVPSSLRNNFGQDGVAKFTNSSFNIIGNQQERQQGLAHATNPESDYNIVSYDLFRRHPEQYLDDSKADTLILDEFHRGKNEGTLTTESLKAARGHYRNLIGLTGSPVSNSLSDIQPLMEVAGNTSLGNSKAEFAHRYFKRDNSKPYRGLAEERRPIIGFHHRKELQRDLGSVVDYVDESEIKSLAHMPNKKIDIVKVPITEEQAKFYRGLLNKNPAVKRMIQAKRSETLKDDETAKAFNQLIEARKLMNSIGSVKPKISLSESAVRTPKTNQLLDDLQEHLRHTPDGQALLFSHLINGGVDVMEQGLKDRHIPYGKFIGKGNEDVTEASRQQDVSDFNAGKKHVMIVSPAGGEGLSLNNTTWEGVLDPHYNPEKMNQMEARGVRSGGLAHRPEAERNVHINRYLATMPKTLGVFKSHIQTPDEFIYEIAQRKDKQNAMLRQLMYDEQKRQRREAAKNSRP